MLRVLDFGAEGLRFEFGQHWKTLTFHPAVNGYLTSYREGLIRQKEKIGHHLSTFTKLILIATGFRYYGIVNFLEISVAIEGSNMIFHSLTFARSRGKC